MLESSMEVSSPSSDGMRQSKKRKLIIAGVAITVAAVALWYDKRFIRRELGAENECFESIAKAISRMANAISMAYTSDSSKVSAEEIFAELSQVCDLQELELLKAYDVLTSNGRKYESFKALPTHLRKPRILIQINK